MATLKDLIKASKTDLPITVRHEKWLTENPNATYSDAAIEFANLALTKAVGGGRKRGSMFRASGLGYCERQRVFKFMKQPERDTIDSHLANIFHTGQFIHLKWQMAGLTEGWLAQAEVPADDEILRFGATLDGILFDGSGFEAKSINSRGYRIVMDSGPKLDHLKQVHGYMMLREDIEKFSILYENKDTGDWREFRVERNQQMIDEVRSEIERLNNHIKTQKLPPIRPKCLEQTGMEYRNCAFRDNCLVKKVWSDLS